MRAAAPVHQHCTPADHSVFINRAQSPRNPLQVHYNRQISSYIFNQRACACRAGRQPVQPTAIGPDVVQHLQRSNQHWLKHSFQTPLKFHDEHRSCTVHVLGVCFWAPLQHELVLQALQQLQPDEVLIEQPQTNSELLLPHPAWVQSVIDYEQCVQALVQLQQQQDPQQQQWQQWQQQLVAFTAELSSSSSPAAKVGKDIMDPVETFGYYAGLDFVKQGDSIAQVLQLCGFLPGQEIVTAAQYALNQGVRLRCIDASLKLQESWVRGLLSSFSNQLNEQAVNSYTPLKDFNTNQQLASSLPDAAAAWDKQLAEAAARLQQQAAEAAAAAPAQPSDPAAAAASAAELEQQALLLFKVSKATAAALLPPDDQQQAEVLARMARLQPLKWRHFALRQQHMAQQIKEAAMAAAKQAQAAGSSSSSSGTQPKQLLVIVGRQHCAALHALWSDPASSLWRTQMPRTFAPSVVEPQAEAAPAAASRPVKQPPADAGRGV